jgi:hypothetical protein
MGQYQQWLHYQAIDRHLRAQAEMLEVELAQLQEQLHLLEQQLQEASPLIDNPIMQALLANLQVLHNSHKSTTKNTNRSIISLASDLQSSVSGDPTSASILSRGVLPNVETHEIKEPHPVAEQALPLTSHLEMELLPEDVVTFFDEHSQTDPQLELPWWLRNITVSSKDDQGSRPIDENSIRTNRLVKRWIERWGRQSPTPWESTEKEEESAHE